MGSEFLRAGRCGWEFGSCRGSCRLERGNLFLPFRLLGDAQLVFHLHTEVVRGPPKLTHEFADLAGEFGKFLGTEEKQRNEEDDGAVLKAHRPPMIRSAPGSDK